MSSTEHLAESVMNSTEHQAESVRGVVLAGGDSTRFEAGDKALATVDAEPILMRIINVLDQTTDRKPVVSVRTAEQRATYANMGDRNTLQFVYDIPDHDGPLAGIFGAATSLDARWLFCCGCDMPLLAPTAVTWMIEQLPDGRTNNQLQVDAIAIEHPTGVVEPLHTLYRQKSIVERQQTLPRAAGPRMLLSELDTVYTVRTVEVPKEVPIDTSTTNVNTLEELETVQMEYLK